MIGMPYDRAEGILNDTAALVGSSFAAFNGLLSSAVFSSPHAGLPLSLSLSFVVGVIVSSSSTHPQRSCTKGCNSGHSMSEMSPACPLSCSSWQVMLTSSVGTSMMTSGKVMKLPDPQIGQTKSSSSLACKVRSSLRRSRNVERGMHCTKARSDSHRAVVVRMMPTKMLLPRRRRRLPGKGAFLLYCITLLHVGCLGFVSRGPSRWLAPSIKPLLHLSTSPSSSTDISIEDVLQERLRRNDTTPVTFTGYVVAKRKLSKKLVFLDFVIPTEDEDSKVEICQALLKRDAYSGSHYAWLQKCLHKGSQLHVSGIAAPTRIPGNVVLLIQDMQLRTVPRQVQHIETILRQALGAIEATRQNHNHEDSLEFVKQIATACGMDSVDDFQTHLLKASHEASTSQDHRKKPLRDLAKTILERLPEDSVYPMDMVDDRILAAKNSDKKAGGNYVLPEAPPKWKALPECFFHNIPSETVEVEGVVQNRRRFQDNIAALILESNNPGGGSDDSSLKDSMERLECILHPEMVEDTTKGKSYHSLLDVGSRVLLRGSLVAEHNDSQGEARPVMWVKGTRLLRASSQPSTLYHLLETVRSGDMGIEEAADALGFSEPDLGDIVTDATSTDLKWQANKLSAKLQMDQTESSACSKLSDDTKATIERYKYLLNDFPVHTTDEAVKESNEVQNDDLDNSSLASRWETKKLPQVKWMCEKIQTVLRQHPEFGTRRLKILDIGGGKGLLATYLSQVIEDADIHVVDISAGAIANGMKKFQRSQTRKNKRPLSMVNFQLADASSSKLKHIDADIVVGLHACGHLTDIALAHAVQREASFVIVPCCFNSNPHLTIPSDSSDSSFSVHDWLGLPETDWSDLKYVAEVQRDAATASLGMHLLNAIRVNAVTKKLQQGANTAVDIGAVDIVSFPIEYSTRNMALVGRAYAQRLASK